MPKHRRHHSRREDVHVSPVYAHALARQPLSFADVRKVDIERVPPGGLPYELLEELGSGAYGSVFRATDAKHRKLFAVKVLHSVEQTPGRHSARSTRWSQCTRSIRSIRSNEFSNHETIHSVLQEVKILSNLQGCSNIVELIGAYDVATAASWYGKEPPPKHPRVTHLAFEYVQNDEPDFLYPRLTPARIRHYMFQLLTALRCCHRRGVFHCDTKPDNLVIDDKRGVLKLVDFGHAKFYWPHETYRTDVLGTVSYRAPEVLLGHDRVYYAIDVWAAGCVFMAMLVPELHRRFWKARHNREQLRRLNERYGTDALHAMCQTYGLHCPALPEQQPKSWRRFFHFKMQSLRGLPIVLMRDIEQRLEKYLDDDACDLLSRLMELEPHKRISCSDALKHRYFDPLHDKGELSVSLSSREPSSQKSSSDSRDSV